MLLGEFSLEVFRLVLDFRQGQVSSMSGKARLIEGVYLTFQA
jgi:hypothetical protein